MTSANGVLYAIRNNLAGTESLFQWTEGGNWKDIGDLNGIGAGGTGGNPGAICLHGNYVYVGGQFTEVSCNGVTVLTGASNIAAFDMVHGTWSVVGNGALTGEEVCAIVFDNLGNLYVGQPSFDGDQTKLVQKWNGAGWSSITGFLNLPLNCVNALAFDGTSLYVGATAPGTSYEGPDFTSLATVLQLNLTTSSWKQMGNPALEGGPLEAGAVVYSLAVQGTDLFAAGIFGPSAESSSSFANIPAVSCYRYNTVSGLRLPFVRLADYSGGQFESVAAAGGLLFWNGSLYLAGQFNAGYDENSQQILFCNNIAKWDGANWSSLANGIDCQYALAPVYLAADSDSIFAAGGFCDVSGVNSSQIARWVTGINGVVPSIAAKNMTPFGAGSLSGANQREQDVYASSQFPGTPVLITEILLQPDIHYGKAFNTTVQNIKINLSTTVAKPNALSSTFANNVGPNPVTVLNGSINVTSTFTRAANGTMNFDIVIPLSTPYLFDPSQGNLLVDIQNTSGSAASSLGGVGVKGDGASRVTGTLTGTIGTPDTGANSMEISYVQTANNTVVPSPALNNTTAFGDGSLIAASERDQTVYASSQFLPFPMLINEIQFQPDINNGKAFETTISRIQIYMSTTAATPDSLSQTFANNVGSSPELVVAGPLSVSSSFTKSANGTTDFDITIPLSTPYLYIPSQGNLLVDIQNTSGSMASTLGGVGVNGDGASRVTGSLLGTTGTADNGANALQVDFTPN